MYAVVRYAGVRARHPQRDRHWDRHRDCHRGRHRPGDGRLRLTAASGVSRRIAAPWERIPVQEHSPVTDEMRQRRLVWLNSQEELARRYPRLGIVLPYDFMLAAAPLTDDETV